MPADSETDTTDDAAGWQQAARRLLHRRFGGELEPLPGTGGGRFTTTVWRTSLQDRSIIAKAGAASGPLVDEIAAYRSAALTSSLPASVTMPSVVDVLSDEVATVLLLEDVGDFDPTTITRSAISSAANALGALTRLRIEEPWCSSTAIEDEWPVIDAGEAPDPRLLSGLAELTATYPALRARLGAMPRGLAHVDAFTRNMRIHGTGSSLTLFDWADAGHAPVGTDLGSFVALGIGYVDLTVDMVDDALDEWIDAFAVGAAADRARIELTVCAVAAMRFVAMMHKALPSAERGDPVVEALVGQPIELTVSAWADGVALHRQLADRAMRVTPSVIG